MRVIEIHTQQWYLHDNGDCINEYNIIYNVFTKESNLKVVPPKLVERLEKCFSRKGEA